MSDGDQIFEPVFARGRGLSEKRSVIVDRIEFGGASNRDDEGAASGWKGLEGVPLEIGESFARASQRECVRSAALSGGAVCDPCLAMSSPADRAGSCVSIASIDGNRSSTALFTRGAEIAACTGIFSAAIIADSNGEFASNFDAPDCGANDFDSDDFDSDDFDTTGLATAGFDTAGCGSAEFGPDFGMLADAIFAA